jgi:hypothetical protein
VVALTIFLSLVGGFVGGFVAWFCSNYFGRPLIKFFDLRTEAHTFLYYYANIKFDQPSHARNVDDAVKCFRWLASRLDAMRASNLRAMLLLFRFLRFDLASAATGLTGLSHNLVPEGEDNATRFRVQAQRALRLPVDPKDQGRVDLLERLTDQPI